MELSVSCGEKVITTPIYIKMDAEDQLLLSEGLCRQLEIVAYHSEVEVEPTQQAPGREPAKVPVVRVRLVKSLRLLPRQSALVRVELEGCQSLRSPVLMEATQETEIRLEDCLVHRDRTRCAFAIKPDAFCPDTEARSVGG